MLNQSLKIMRCPDCKGSLAPEHPTSKDSVVTGLLQCQKCKKNYCIKNGIPQFVNHNELRGMHKIVYRNANFNSHFYIYMVKLVAIYLQLPEEVARREYLAKLELVRHARILEIGVGPGRNISYFFRQGSDVEFFGLDLSTGMLAQCAKNARKWPWKIELLHGIAEKLPFRDESFDVVFHVGGINAFEDKSQAIKEMIRVAKPGTKIVIADEWLDPRTLKRFGERLLCKVFPSIVTRTQPPIELIPGDMLEIQINPI
jgi:SAM-dependent methyltransferase